MDPMSTPHPAIRLLDEMAAAPIETVVAKTVVVDRLLDLRNVLGDRPNLVAVIDDSLRDVPGATICLWQPGHVYEVQAADETGMARFAFEPAAGKLRVAVSGPSVNVGLAEIEVR